VPKPTEPKLPPIRRKSIWDWRPWKPGDLKTPSTGNAARDVFPHLPSAVKPEIDNTKPKGKGDR
jgi:hypothetical protein